MPVNSGERVYRIVLHSLFQEEPLINRFYYIDYNQAHAVADLGLVYNQFKTIVIDTGIRPAVSANYQFVRVVIEAMREGFPTEVHEVPIASWFGQVIGSNMPQINSYGFKYVGSTRETRPGGKRVSGLTDDLAEGKFLTSTGITHAVQMAEQFSFNLQPAIGYELQPSIVKETVYVNKQRVPLPFEQWVFNPVSQVQHKLTIRPQSSRKGPSI